MHRRDFLRFSGASLAAATITGGMSLRARAANDEIPASIRDLQAMTDGVEPISVDERKRRIEKARQIMKKHKIDALYLEPGTSMRYFLDVQFWLSERMIAAIIPARGEIVYVAPAFEERKLGELISIDGDVRTWHEHASPYALVAQCIRDLGGSAPVIGVEERVRFFLVDGIRTEAPRTQFVLGTPVTAGCRMIKTPTELALMQHANDVTIEAYKALVVSLEEGMTQHDFRALSRVAHENLGYEGQISANFAAASAFPHGSAAPQRLKEGDIVLMDGGCNVEGYRSDISRTIVFGEPNQRQTDVWNLEKQAQASAFAAIEPGVPCSHIDAVARQVIEEGGFGAEYEYFTHRVGHGIGMDGHEWPYLVRGNDLPLQPGMCFSDEPGIYITGEFGVRLEDCFYVTEDGAQFFTTPSPAIDRPFA